MQPQEISVNEAIKKGRLLITLPAIVIFVACLLISIYISLIYFSQNKYFVYFATILSMLISLIYNLFTIPKWKIWAFGNVRNVNELMNKAQYNGLIIKENSWLGKLQFYTKSEREKWNEIQKKFLIPDDVKDDKNIPNEIVVYGSEFKLWLPVIFYSILLIAIVASMISDKSWLGLGIFLLMGLGLILYFDIISLSKRKIPILIINQNGIKNQDGEMFYWKDIKNERLTKSYPSRGLPIHFLTFNKIDNNDEINIDIDKMKISRKELFNILIVLRSRFNQPNN